MVGSNNDHRKTMTPMKKLLLLLGSLMMFSSSASSVVDGAAVSTSTGSSSKEQQQRKLEERQLRRNESRDHMKRLLSSKDDPNEQVQVIVGFPDIAKQTQFENIMDINLLSNESTVSKVTKFHHTNTVTIELSAYELNEILEKTSEFPQFDYIEEDSSTNIVPFNNNQNLPYGIGTVMQAGSSTEVFNNIPLPPEVTSSEDCFRVCVVDSGLIEGHTDMEFDRSSMESYRFNGNQFDLPNGQMWYNPDPFTANHGTHVTGTIFASGSNGQGVIGVVPSVQGMCLSIARVFQDGFNPTTSTSAVNEAVEWCADEGSKIINLSLGSGSDNFSSEDLYKKLYSEDNILIIAAAGNGGLGNDAFEYQYPASYEGVISVAAVDSNDDRASFSQQNDEVDIAAPGVEVLSMAGGTIDFVNSEENNLVYIGGVGERVMEYSRNIDPADSNDFDDFFNGDLELVDCGLANPDDGEDGDGGCPNAEDKICLIERGEYFFWEKAIHCQNGGGIMALIYNNEPNNNLFFGTLTKEEEDNINIPVFSLRRSEGENLLETVIQEGLKVNLIASEFGYSYLSGTSMASPHIAGVAARIWASRPQCTNQQVEQAIMVTALDLGVEGKDIEYGAGLVRGVDAYNYLLTEFPEPCGEPFDNGDDGNGDDDCGDLRDTCDTDDDCCPSFFCSPIEIGGPKFCRGRPQQSAGKDQYSTRFGSRGGSANNRQSGGATIPGEPKRRRNLLGGGALRGATTTTTAKDATQRDIPEIDNAADDSAGTKQTRSNTVNNVDFNRADK